MSLDVMLAIMRGGKPQLQPVFQDQIRSMVLESAEPDVCLHVFLRVFGGGSTNEHEKFKSPHL